MWDSIINRLEKHIVSSDRLDLLQLYLELVKIRCKIYNFILEKSKNDTIYNIENYYYNLDEILNYLDKNVEDFYVVKYTEIFYIIKNT